MTPTARECRQRPEVELACPRCGKQVTLYAETREWTQGGEHTGYGPASGECCGLAFVDFGGQVHVIRLSARPMETKRRLEAL